MLRWRFGHINLRYHIPPATKHNCSVLEFPVSEWVDPYGSMEDLVPMLSTGFGLEWKPTKECEGSNIKKGGVCSQNETTGQLTCSDKQGRNWPPLSLFFILRIHVSSFHISYLVLPLLYYYNNYYYFYDYFGVVSIIISTQICFPSIVGSHTCS